MSHFFHIQTLTTPIDVFLESKHILDHGRRGENRPINDPWPCRDNQLPFWR